jgi:hypothetical protein
MSAEQERLATELKRALLARQTTDAPRFAAEPQAPRAAVRASSGISFTQPLLAAVLKGAKTETRRPIRPIPSRVESGTPFDEANKPIAPLASVGERLWVREKWARREDGSFVYAIDEPKEKVRWIASRYMPRAASRHHLRVRDVEVARLNDIDDAAAIREGVAADDSPRDAFFVLWDSIYGETEFAVANNPWVWVIGFEVERS